MTVLAHQAICGGFEVATVDHGLRAEAPGEAVMVAAFCKKLDIAHRTLRINVPTGTAVQERARNARYAGLAGWMRERGLVALLTAHHLDDQAETLVMRLNRGAGVRGLAGMRPRSSVPGDAQLPLLRPLLGWRRSELRAVVDASGLAPADDASNRDLRFERARIRASLADAEWLDPVGLAEAARHLAAADEGLDWAANAEWEATECASESCTYAPAAPRAVRLRVLERIIAQLGGTSPRGRDVVQWLDRLEAGGVATLGGVRGDGRKLPWRFTLAPAHRLQRSQLS